MKKLLAFGFVLFALLSGCKKEEEPKNMDYWLAHLDEAKAYWKECTNLAVRPPDCSTALRAIEKAAREQTLKELGIK